MTRMHNRRALMGGNSRPRRWATSAALDDLQLVTQPPVPVRAVEEVPSEALGFDLAGKLHAQVERGSD